MRLRLSPLSILLLPVAAIADSALQHSDGEIAVSLAIRIVDSRTEESLGSSKVIYVSKVEELRDHHAMGASTDAAEAAISHGPKVTSFSNSDGLHSISARFDAAFLWTMKDGSKVSVGTDIFPAGHLVISASGFTPMRIQASRIYGTRCSSEDLDRLVTIKLVKVE